MSDAEIPAIFFHPDQIEGAGKDLVGRRSAGQSFLKGWLRHAGGAEVRAVTETNDGAKGFEEAARALGETRPMRVSVMRGGGDFTKAGTVFFPTPGYQRAPWLRQRFGQKSCSLVGITHTVSTRRIIDSLHTLHGEPIEDWDAIICTSRAVRSVVRRQFELEAEYFRQRFGAARVPQPQLPVIPLGIDADDFTPIPGARERLRAQFGVPDDAVVVMTMGRLSVVEKANPVPLYIALQMLAQQIKQPIHLWQVGWASRKEEEELHRDGAAQIARNLTSTIIDGREPDIRRNIWAAADIFTLPTDSIQETFGLVPVEAMAAGLPVVMPDWDGYRDTIVHGKTGFLVPTRMARAGTGIQLARRFADETDGYLHYLTLVQSQVQLDVPAYARALGTLIQNREARRTMGAAGAAHVRATLDWSAVIPQYLGLARDLTARRMAGTATTPPLSSGPISPLEVDPFDLYADYPTAVLDIDVPLAIGLRATNELVALFDRISGRDLYKRRAFDVAQLGRILKVVSGDKPVTTRQVAATLAEDLAPTEAAVLYLAKADFLRLPGIAPRG